MGDLTASSSAPHGTRQSTEGQSNINQIKLDDVLGEFISMDEDYLNRNSWVDLFHRVKGRSNFATKLQQLRHPARHLLQRYAREGVPVLVSSEPWTLERKDAAMLRGNHPSTAAFSSFITDEMTDMRSKGIFILLPYASLRHFKSLRISPLGCMPQRERRPRIINDYTFSGVNPATVKMAHQEAMQWGRTLHRILWYTFTADRRHGPVLLSKTDLSDGFYQLHLTPTGALKLAVPFDHHGRRLLAVPTRLPMGWTESPPVFSAVTETIADLVNERLEQGPPMPPPHPFETLASTQVALEEPLATDRFPLRDAGPIRPPLAYVDVYVDDFIKLAQGFHNSMRVRRHTYHAIDEVFRRNDGLDQNRKEPISQKKLRNGDDSWSTRKTILGWVVNTATQTIHLPQHRQDKLLSLLRTMVSRKRVSIKEWHKLLGELRSMSLALPGSSGCFSLLQTLLQPDKKRLKITEAVRHQLLDFLWLAESVSERPTHLAEVVPTPPSYLGTVDAAKEGMGGVWFPPLRPKPLEIQYPRKHQLQGPILWRARFPKQVQDLLVSQDNPRGSITNSDLELAGAVAHDDVLATSAPRIAHASTCSFSDNTPAVSWKTKGSTTTTGPAAYILQISALHKRHHRYQNQLSYLPGPLNLMADDCSRLWNLTDSQLLTYFNSRYPQSTSWTMRHLRPEMHSALTSALLRKRSQPELYLRDTKRDSKLGASGWRFASPLMLTPISRRWPTLSSSSKPLACAGETDAFPQVISPIELDRWRTQSGLSARGFPSWGPKTLGLTMPASKISV